MILDPIRFRAPGRLHAFQDSWRAKLRPVSLRETLYIRASFSIFDAAGVVPSGLVSEMLFPLYFGVYPLARAQQGRTPVEDVSLSSFVSSQHLRVCCNAVLRAVNSEMKPARPGYPLRCPAVSVALLLNGSAKQLTPRHATPINLKRRRTASSLCTSRTPRRRQSSTGSRRPPQGATRSSWPPTRTERARPSAGTCCRWEWEQRVLQTQCQAGRTGAV